MPYTSFAVVGVGFVGTPIVQALVKTGASVVVLARQGSKSAQNPLLEGAKIATVEFTDVKQVASVLLEHKVEVIVSAVGTESLKGQWPVADAAKEAGVKVFVPSEFGLPTEGLKEGPLSVKDEFAEYVKSLGISVVRIYNGLFTEFIPWLAVVDKGKFHLVGEQTNTGSFTSREDVAGFLAHVLTTLPNESLQNATFRIEGERASLSAIGALYQARSPPVPVAHVTELPEGSGLQQFLQSEFEAARFSSGLDHSLNKDIPENAASGNKAWEGHKWKSIKEVHGL